MLASPEASAPPQFPSAKCDQSTCGIRGQASLLPKCCRHCTPSAFLHLPAASAHIGVHQTRREGAQVTCLLSFPNSPPPAGLGPMGSTLQQHSRLGLQLQALLQWGQPTEPRLAPTLKGARQPRCPPRSSHLPIAMCSTASIPLPGEAGVPLPGR